MLDSVLKGLKHFRGGVQFIFDRILNNCQKLLPVSLNSFEIPSNKSTIMKLSVFTDIVRHSTTTTHDEYAANKLRRTLLHVHKREKSANNARFELCTNLE
jgi:hypothetical protein